MKPIIEIPEAMENQTILSLELIIAPIVLTIKTMVIKPQPILETVSLLFDIFFIFIFVGTILWYPLLSSFSIPQGSWR